MTTVLSADVYANARTFAALIAEERAKTAAERELADRLAVALQMYDRDTFLHVYGEHDSLYDERGQSIYWADGRDVLMVEIDTANDRLVVEALEAWKAARS